MTPEPLVFQCENKKLLTYGKWTSLALALITIITFGLAMIAVPISGSNAPADSLFKFPYLNTLTQFPRDFLWQYLALAQLVVFLVFITLIRQNTPKDRRFFSQLSHSLALLAVGVLAFAYYTQVNVIPASLAKNQTDGLGLIIQYNPQGLFIALEELGYLFMILSLAALIPLADGKSKIYRPIKILLIIAGILALGSFVSITAIFGLDKQDRFEIAIISINWLTLIILGFMFYRIYRKENP